MLEICQRRWKLVNTVGNSSTTFRGRIVDEFPTPLYHVFAFFNRFFQELDPLDQLHHLNPHLIWLRSRYQQHQVD